MQKYFKHFCMKIKIKLKMKTLLINLVLIISFSGVIAQKPFEYDLSGIKKVKIKVNGDLKVVGKNSGKMIMTLLDDDHGHDHDNDCHHNYNHNHHAPNCEHGKESKEDYDEKRKGLKPIYSGGVDNTGLGVRVEKDGNELTVKNLKNQFSGGDYLIEIPPHIEVSIDNIAYGDVYIEKIDSDIEIISNIGDVEIFGVTGPITASSAVGDISVVFTKVNQSAPITIRAQTGDVEVSIPANSKLDLELNSSMGDVYTDLNVDINQEGKNSMFGQRIKCKLNNGGVKMSLSSNIGDVLLRKN